MVGVAPEPDVPEDPVEPDTTTLDSWKSGFTYTEDADTGLAIISGLSESGETLLATNGELIIPSVLVEMGTESTPIQVQGIADGSFSGNLDIEYVFIMDDETDTVDGFTIDCGSNVFNGCSNLKDVFSYNNKCASSTNKFGLLSNIGNGVFEGCTSLRYFNTPFDDFGEATGVFTNCTGLRIVYLNTDANIPISFTGCTALKMIDYGQYTRSNRNSVQIFDTVIPLLTWVYTDEDASNVAITGQRHMIVEQSAKVFSDVLLNYENCDEIVVVSLYDDIADILGNTFSTCTSLERIRYQGNKPGRDRLVVGDGNDYLLNATWTYGVVI